MARTARSTRKSSTTRASNALEQAPDATQSGIEPADAPEETQSAPVLKRSKRVSKPTERISTHVEQQANRHIKSGQIKRTKARTARKAQKKQKKRIESPNLSDTDFTGDDDNDNNNADLWEDDDLNESVAGLDEDGAEVEVYEPETHSFEDTDINTPDTRSNRDVLLERLQEATDKDFSSYSTKELQDFWKAFCEDQEALDEAEVQYPQITQVGTFKVSPRPSSAVDKQPERAKRALTESVDVASKRACLSVDPPSSNPQAIAPPLFPAHPAQTTQGTRASRQAQPAGPPTPSASRASLRAQNAPSLSLAPGSTRLPATAPLVAFPTATTVLDDPPCPLAPPRMATPAPPRVPAIAPARAPAPVAAPARALARTAAPAPARALARTAAPAPARALTRTAASAPTRAPAPAPATTSSRASSSRAPVAVSVPGRTPAPSRAPVAAPSRAAAMAYSRPPAARAAPRASVPTGLRMPSVPEAEPDWSIDLGGPAPGVPARVRPYVRHTDLLEDRAEEIAGAEARHVGKRVAGRKQKHTAKDYHGDARRMIPHTVKRQFALSIVEGAYDNRGIMMDLSQLAFEEMWPVLFPTKELQYPDEFYFPMITNRGATERGDVRKHIRPIVHHSIANFLHPARTREDMEHNKREVKRLLPRLFHYEVQDPPSKPYSNIEIQRALGAGLFHSLSAVGVVHRNRFGPQLPLQAMAFILTNIKVCIMEFADGCFQTIELNVLLQLEMYMTHLRGLEAYERRAPTRLSGMQEEWFKYALAFAGVEDTDDEAAPGQSELDLLADIPPDSPEPNAPEPDVLDGPDVLNEPEALGEPTLGEAAPGDEDGWGWQPYQLEDLYGDNATEPEPEPEPKPEPQPEYHVDGRLTARTKGKGRATGPSSSRNVERRAQTNRPRSL